MSAALEAEGIALGSQALIALRSLALNVRDLPSLSPLPGGFATKRKGQGQEIADLREYQTGDDIRRLDRNTTARTGRLHIRQYQEDRDRASLLVADFRAPMFWGISRALLSVAAAEALSLIGWHIVEQGGRVGLLAITDQGPVIVPPRGRVRGMLDVIGGLTQAHAAALSTLGHGTGETPALGESLIPVERLCPSGSEVYVASGFDAPGPGLADQLERIERRRALSLVAVTDADAVPAGRYPVRLADGRRLRLNLTRPPESSETITIANRTALRLSASLYPQEQVQKLAALFARQAP